MAPASPYFFDPTVFMAAADEALARGADSPSDTVARDALPSDGTVLDVGVGAGAGCLRLADRAGHLTGVDSSRELLDAFTERATQRGIGTATIEGRWPEVASQAQPAHVVVCHHAVYNVSDLASFAAALSAHATRRVVVELTAQHPMTWMIPYWKAVHGITLPDRPTVDDAVDVLSASGLNVQQRRWRRPVQMIGETGIDQVASIARRLCSVRTDTTNSASCLPPFPHPPSAMWPRCGGTSTAAGTDLRLAPPGRRTTLTVWRA